MKRADVGTGAGGVDDPATTEATPRVNRSVDCPEAPAQAHIRALAAIQSRAAAHYRGQRAEVVHQDVDVLLDHIKALWDQVHRDQHAAMEAQAQLDAILAECAAADLAAQTAPDRAEYGLVWSYRVRRLATGPR